MLIFKKKYLFLYQSWGFYTNNPLLSNLEHYEYQDDKIKSIHLNTTTLHSYLGLQRDVKRTSNAFNFVYKNIANR